MAVHAQHPLNIVSQSQAKFTPRVVLQFQFPYLDRVIYGNKNAQFLGQSALLPGEYGVSKPMPHPVNAV